MKPAKSESISVRLDKDLKERLVASAQKLDLSENDIARHAIRAAVTAIEANNYRIELPLEMQVKKGPVTSMVPAIGMKAQVDRLLGGASASRKTLHGANEPEGRYKTRKPKQ
jgi:hypothetical protein